MNDAPKPPLTTTTSLWPAAAVLGIAVVMLVVFMIINLAANQGVTKETTTTVPYVVGGLQRDATPNAALNSCRQSTDVPANIFDAFVFPVGTSPRGAASTPNAGAGDYDCYEPMVTTKATSASLISFFNAQLAVRGWSLFSQGASNGEAQSLFQKAGTDGFYWVVGVTVTSSNASNVEWTYRIYQNSQTI